MRPAFPARELRCASALRRRRSCAKREALFEADQDRLIERDGEAFRVTDRGRPFVRAIAACFDAYFDTSVARHAPGI